jgi:hypothetical protein
VANIYTVKERDGFKLLLNDDSRMGAHELLITKFNIRQSSTPTLKAKERKLTNVKTRNQLLKRELDLGEKEIQRILKKTQRSKRTRKTKIIFDM